MNWDALTAWGDFFGELGSYFLLWLWYIVGVGLAREEDPGKKLAGLVMLGILLIYATVMAASHSGITNYVAH